MPKVNGQEGDFLERLGSTVLILRNILDQGLSEGVVFAARLFRL